MNESELKLVVVFQTNNGPVAVDRDENGVEFADESAARAFGKANAAAFAEKNDGDENWATARLKWDAN